jgi:hypothetical protein
MNLVPRFDFQIETLPTERAALKLPGSPGPGCQRSNVTGASFLLLSPRGKGLALARSVPPEAAAEEIT